MQIKVADIIAEARSGWIDPDPGFITIIETLRWFNIAQQDFVTKTRCLTGNWAVTTVADTQEYIWDAADKIMQIRSVQIAGKDIFPVTEAELTSYDRNWRQSAGGATDTPEWYYVDHEANVFGLFPCPDEELTVNVTHVAQPTILELSGEALPDAYPDIASSFHHMLIPFIEWFGHKKNRDAQAASIAWRGYVRYVRDTQEILKNQQPERARCMKGPEYTMRPGRPNYPKMPDSITVT